MARSSNYDKFPYISVTERTSDRQVGWHEIGQRLGGALPGSRAVLCVECYPGVFLEGVEAALVQQLNPRLVICSASCFKNPQDIDALVEPYLGGDDPVFGRMNGLTVQDFLSGSRRSRGREHILPQGEQQGCIL